MLARRLIVVAWLCSLGCRAGASAQAAPAEGESVLVAAPPGWKIESVRSTGSGCPASVPLSSAWISPEGDELEVDLRVAVNLAATDARPEDSASCTLIIGLRVPEGYAYAPTHLRVGGRSLLPAGVHASLITTYGYQGSGLAQSHLTQRIATPSALEAFDFADDFAGSPVGLQWSRCGEQQLLNVNMVLHLRNSDVKQSAWAELSSATALRLVWKRCP